MRTDESTDAPTSLGKGELGADGSGLRTPAAESSARERLFARLAVINGFVDEKTVEIAHRQRDASKSLPDVLVESGALTVDERDALELLLARRLEKNNGDSQQSLQGLHSATVSYRQPADSEETFVPGARSVRPLSLSFGDYEIIEPIAEGGMGVVYKARQTRLDRLVALKMIRAGQLADDEQVERFYAEAKAAAKLDHPGIVPVYEVGHHNGEHFFSMAFVEGASLHDRVKDAGPLPPKRAAEIVKSAAEAVQFGHDKGVVHRDIKPRNILVDEGGAPRVTDFGLAKQGDSELTVAGQVLGTPSYMPPEQAEGRLSQIGPTSDVYSLGATLYYLLTGRPPFQAATPTETLHQVVQSEPVPPRRLNPAIPHDLETICLKCLHKEQAGRYAKAQDLTDDLGRWLQHAPIVARRVSVVEKTWLWCKRKPLVSSLIAMVFVVVAVAALAARQQHLRGIAANNRTRARELVTGLKKAEIEQVPAIVEQFDGFRRWTDPILRTEINACPDGSPEKLRLSLALLPQDEDQVAYLLPELLEADPPTSRVVRAALRPQRTAMLEPLWQVLEDDRQPAPARLNSACALAAFDFTDRPENLKRWQRIAPLVTQQLLTTIRRNPSHYVVAVESLRPARGVLLEPLAKVFRDAARTESEQNAATNVLADFAADRPEVLADLLCDAGPDGFAILFDKLRRHSDQAIDALHAQLETPADRAASNGVLVLDDASEALAKRRASAAVALLRMNQPEKVWPLLVHGPDPRTRSYLIHRWAPLGADAESLRRRLEGEQDVSIRRALILSLGEFSADDLAEAKREALVDDLTEMFRSDPDPGIHAAAEWLLRKWGHDQTVTEVLESLKEDERQFRCRDPQDARRWYVTTQGQTMMVLDADEFLMSSPAGEDGRKIDELQHTRRIGRRFAMASTEVTKAQYERFRQSHPTVPGIAQGREAAQPNCPAGSVTWYEAAAYCNWLSREEGIPESEWCYEPREPQEFRDGMKMAPDYLQRQGYRLPSEAEWEFACRAGTLTSRYCGQTEELVPQYAWYLPNASVRSWPVGMLKPNDFGMFDMLGNALEWCQNSHAGYRKGTMHDAPQNVLVRNKGNRVLRGGAYNWSPHYIRAANRSNFSPDTRVRQYGFRPSRTLD